MHFLLSLNYNSVEEITHCKKDIRAIDVEYTISTWRGFLHGFVKTNAYEIKYINNILVVTCWNDKL
jgi:hypothetical protein